MGIKYKIPIELLKQDANDGVWKHGSIEMTSGQYTMAETLNDIKDELTTLRDMHDSLQHQLDELRFKK